MSLQYSSPKKQRKLRLQILRLEQLARLNSISTVREQIRVSAVIILGKARFGTYRSHARLHPVLVMH